MVKDLELDNLTIYLYVKNDESGGRLSTVESWWRGCCSPHPIAFRGGDP